MPGNVEETVENWLKTLDLDEVGDVLASQARVLAAQLDLSAHSTNGTVVSAMPTLSKELRAVMDAIRESAGNANEYLAPFFAAVGDAEDA